MNSEQGAIHSREEENRLNLKDLFNIVCANWYWFLLSVLICCGGAALYLKWAPKVYTRTASILIKDNSKGGSIGESAAFEDLNMFNFKSNVDNEVLVFQSKRLMTIVAERLNLDISYRVKEGLRTLDLYTQSPVMIQFQEAEATQEFSLVVTPLSAQEVMLSGFSTDRDKTLKVALNDTVHTPVGRLVVIPTLYYMDKYWGKEITSTKRIQNEVAFEYCNALQVALASKTSTIINLTLQDVSIPRAEDVLNMLIAVYNEDAISDKNRITVSTSDFINERLIIIERELGSVDTDIETYKRENQLTDIHSETGRYLQESSQYSQDGLSLDNQVALARFIREYLIDPRKIADLIPSNTGISDVNIEGQIGEYNNLLLKRNKLISNSSDKNPVVMDLNNSLGAMRQSIIRAVDNLIVGLNIKMKNIKEREMQTSRRISAVPTQQKYVLSVERQQKIKEELYLYLLNKREENALSQAITESNARIIDVALGSKKPVAPQSMMILMAAFILGLAVPAGTIWLQMILNTAVRTRKDLEDTLTIPILGEIPERTKKDKSEVVVCENGRDSISEAFRMVRTNMEFMRVKTKDMKVVMFTSFNPGAGKTFVSINLAMSFALTNKKTILVDLDIRKGTLSSHISSANMGITNYLSGKIENVDDIICKGELYEKLDIIHVGPIPPNPSELLLSGHLDDLIGVLRERYDYIILDNVPGGMVADAAIVNRVADLTIYVIRAGLMDRRQLPEVEKLYRQDKFRNMSLILNGVSYSRTSYGYSNNYGYGYGYENKKKR